MLDYLESLLDRFMNDLPSDYCNYSLPEQPDAKEKVQVVIGETHCR